MRHLAEAKSYCKIRSWSKEFVLHLISISHSQWIYRNARVLMKRLEGKTEEEHRAIMEEVRSMMNGEPTELLPQH